LDWSVGVLGGASTHCLLGNLDQATSVRLQMILRSQDRLIRKAHGGRMLLLEHTTPKSVEKRAVFWEEY
jgi:hypothetical protein